jgi:hypothetical protein
MDDLGVVDPTQIHRGDGEIGMAELALDDQQRHILAGHWQRRAAGSARRPVPTGDLASRLAKTQNSAPTGSTALSCSHGSSRCQPQMVHSDLAAFAALAVADQDRASAGQVAVGQRGRFADAKSRPP